MRRLLYWTTKKLYALLTTVVVNVCVCKCFTIQFTEPEGAFLLKPISDSSSQSSSSTTTKGYTTNNYSFFVLKDGHIGNKLIVTDSGFTVEENLENLMLQNYSNSLLSVQVLSSKINKEQPTVRIFVHHRSMNVNNLNSQKQTQNKNNFKHLPCVVVYGVYKNEVVFGQCRPLVTEFGVCIVDLVIPLLWWPRQPYRDNTGSVSDDPPKRPKTIVKIGYVVSYDDDQVCHNEPTLMTPKTIDKLGFEKSLTFVGDVELIGRTEYVCLPFDKILNILVPNREFHPGNIFTSTIFYRYNPAYTDQPPFLFQIRCHAAEGIRILGTEEIPQSGWSAPSEMNYKLSTLTITAFYRGQFNTNESWSGEIITLVLQVAPDAKHESVASNNENSTAAIQKPTLTSSISYIVDAKLDAGLSSSSETINDKNENITKTLNVQTSFNIEKDAVQSLVPVGKFDLVNTAVLTGKQASVGLKVFSVSHAGIVSDVTLQSNCVAREPSVLKVTPSCTSVYVDGSESRGDTNASIEIDFGSYKGLANFKVWYPEFPVEVQIADPVLHAIKSWRIVERPLTSWRRKKRNHEITQDTPKVYSRCRLRYQESMVKVFARFRVDDLTTGRRSYLGGRKLQMDVTYLSRSHLKVVDPKIAQIKIVDGVVLVQGNYPGRTELKLISPYSRIPFGAGQVEVTNEKLTIRNLRAQSLAGISLTITSDLNVPEVYTIVVHKSRIFSKKYQEGRFSVAVEYSNGFSFPLNFIDVTDYRLDVAVKDSSIALVNDDNHALGLPNFLTVEETKGNVLYLSLFPASPCQRDIDGPLFSTTVFVEAYFPVSDQQSFVRSKEKSKEGFSAIELPQSYIAGLIPADNSKQVSANLGLTNRPSSDVVRFGKQSTQTTTVTPAEVAMYIFLAIFALIGSAFALHCFASTSRRPKFKYLLPEWLRLPNVSDRLTGIFRGDAIASARQEFVWVGPEELQDSLNSRCSHRLLKNGVEGEEEWEDCDDEELESKCATLHNATFPVSSTKTAAYHANRISYLGSEVSIHMCPKPLMEVHGPHGRRAASWNHGRAAVGHGLHHHRVRITSNPIGDSSSEQNLSSYCAVSPPPWTARSAADLHWDSASLGMNDSQLRDYFNSLRESMA